MIQRVAAAQGRNDTWRRRSENRRYRADQGRRPLLGMFAKRRWTLRGLRRQTRPRRRPVRRMAGGITRAVTLVRRPALALTRRSAALMARAVSPLRRPAARLVRPAVTLARRPARGVARPMALLRRAVPDGMAAVTLLTLAFATGASAFVPSSRGHAGTARPAGVPLRDPSPSERPNASAMALAPRAVSLPAAVTAPRPAPPSVTAVVLRPHEVFGFAPYWTLPSSGGFNLADLTTVAYFGVDVAGDGSIVQSGPGWTGYESQALSELISRAHAAGVRVVLTVESFDPAALHQLASDPAADQRLADNMIAGITAKAMDGANIDFEGTGTTDRAGMARLVRYVSQRLRAADPHWQVTVDTYGSSATDSGGFFDVQSMASAVDAFFVMAYDMYHSGFASPNAPLDGDPPSDRQAVAGYTSVLPAGKVILGIPFYGYSWETASNAPRAPAVSGPTPLTYAQVAATPTPAYWDAQAAVPWTAFQDGGHNWHEAYFDDPQSVALKAQLADRAHLLGVGVWALGSDGNDPAMMSALLGHALALKTYQAGPAPTPAASPPSTTSTSSPSSTPASSATTTTTTTQPPRRPSPTVPPSSEPPPPIVTTPSVTLPGKVVP